MTDALRADVPDDVAAAVAAAHRDHWGTVLAATVALTRDLDLAEDSVQEACVQALRAWTREGIPENRAGWLTTAARRRALDAIRRSQTLQRKLPLLVWDAEGHRDDAMAGTMADDGPATVRRIEDEAAPVVLDERLRLIFLAAHPALAPTSRIALTLRLVSGLSTEQIAAAFHLPTATMAARLTRAKKRIRLSRIPCRVPGAAELDGRLVDVLDVLSVLLAVGMRGKAEAGGDAGPRAAGDGETTRTTDAQAAVLDSTVHTLQVLGDLLPHHSEPRGLLAQALLLQARASTRIDERGRPVALAEQDRTAWDRELIERADHLVIGSLARGGRGPYLVQAAISAAVAVPARHEDIDWCEVVELYDALLMHWPTALVQLGRVVAVSEAEGAAVAFDHLEPLADELDAHRSFHVIRGELLGRLGAHEAAASAFRTALDRQGSAGESEVLREMLRAR